LSLELRMEAAGLYRCCRRTASDGYQEANGAGRRLSPGNYDNFTEVNPF